MWNVTEVKGQVHKLWPASNLTIAVQYHLVTNSPLTKKDSTEAKVKLTPHGNT